MSDLTLLLVAIWFACGFFASGVASQKGRDGTGWFFVGLVFGPIGVLAALVTGSDTAALDREALNRGALRKCPSCAELIRSEAVRCRFCGTDLLPAPPGGSE